MVLKKVNKMAALALAAVLASEAGLTSFVPLTAEAKEKTETVEEVVVASSTGTTTDKFTWDNVTAYFVLTDRFLNADTSNDHSYGRGLQADGKTPVVGLEDPTTNPGTFHGGDLKGLTQKVKEGYFTDLGVNAIWITAPYEQIHGYTSGNVQSNAATTANGQGFPYYSYHGYWTLDYTNIDENMGNEQDFEEFVDSCHEKGIRVIMDVVMNHVGYTTMQDAQDYGFDSALKGDWKSYYYGPSADRLGGDPEANNYWDSSASVWASKWWGPGFVRADYPGYTAAGGGDEYMSLCGLPDVMTESSASEVSTPPLLVTKWTQEGRLSEEQKELDDFFAETGYKKQARYYIIKWLTDWVREYGVDGFRCDTAKHVSLDAWNDLKTEGVKALEEWRANNPDKAGADWTDEFWMTGECWGHGMDKSPYHTSGGFDSMINFGFPKNADPSQMEGTYSSYAAINDDPEWNTLSYINSHDDNDSAKVTWNISDELMMQNGTSLLLSPGGVQIYYGNEVNRGLEWDDFFTGSDYLDQRFRSDMDWDNVNTKVLTHWQKVGQFRNNHPAVGAGQHQKLEGDVYTFARTYHLEEEDEDKVVVALPQKAGTFTVSVGDVFEDGEVLTDAYSGKTYTVAGGAVEATTADANSPILLQGSGIVKPSVNAKLVSGSKTYKTETIQVNLRANRVTDATYSINGGAEQPYTAGDILTLGGGTAYGEETTLTLKAKSEDDGSEITKVITYTKCDEPMISDGFKIKAKKSDFSTAPSVYVYSGSGTTATQYAGAWPGTTMTEDEEDSDYWVFENEEVEEAVKVILVCGNWRSHAEGVEGLEVENAVLYDKETNSATQIPAGEPGRVDVKYVDQSGNEIKTGVYRVGAVGRKYATSAADIPGYTLVETPTNAEGTFETQSTVTYVYQAGENIPTRIPVVTSTPTPTAEPTTEPVITSTPDPTTEPVVTSTPDPTTEPVVTSTPGAFSLDGFSVVKAKDGIGLYANTSGAEGNVRYMFSYEKNGKEILIANFQSESRYVWITAQPGTYKINVYAINNGVILEKSVEEYTVK
jgi:alpha-amylase